MVFLDTFWLLWHRNAGNLANCAAASECNDGAAINFNVPTVERDVGTEAWLERYRHATQSDPWIGLKPRAACEEGAPVRFERRREPRGQAGRGAARGCALPKWCADGLHFCHRLLELSEPAATSAQVELEGRSFSIVQLKIVPF